MKLTSLELLGFKSFFNRTSFRFNEGVTCIVGPNGCGKSNIVDAITWVLGERGTKSLRVKEMGDVIFHGSNAKKQVNMAEVTMGLTNDEREYAIRRRIYRDGTNEYYLNGEMVRLKDIQDFLLGTGIGLHSYAIVEQGNIEYFAQMKPQERRIAVEETSGITRFEEKKRDAFSRLEEVKANLERVEDIQREVVKGFEKAEEESARLKVYNGLKERLREIDVALLLDGYGKVEKRTAKLMEREEALLREMEAKETQRQGLKQKVGAKEEEIALIDAVTRKTELDIKDKEKDMESRLLELEYLEGEKRRLDAAMADLRREIDALSEKISLNGSDIEVLTKSAGQEKAGLERIEESGRSLEARRAELKRVREGLEKEAEEGRNRLFGVMTRITELRNSILERERVLKEREARRQRRLEEEKLLKEKLLLLEGKLSPLQRRMDEEKIDKVRLEGEEKELNERLDKLSREAEQVRNSIEGLKGVKRGKEEVFRQMKSYGEGKQKVSNPYKQLINILKPSKDTEHVLEKFFSKEMEYHVLTDQDPLNLSTMAEEYGGNFVFFPKKGMFGLQGGEADIRIERVGSLSDAFKRIDGGEDGLFLSGNVLVDSRGFIRKEQDKSSVSIREFREKMKLETELAELDEQLKVKTARLNDLQQALKELEKTRQILGEKKRVKDASVTALEREIIDLGAQVRTAGERLGESALRTEPAIEEDPSALAEQSAAEREKWEAEKGRIEQALVDLKGRLETAKEDYSQTDGEFHDTSIAIERSRNQLRKDEEEAARKRAAVETNAREKGLKLEKVAQTERDLKSAVAKAGELEKSYEILQEESRKAVARYEEMKKKLGDLHMEKSSTQEELQAVDQELEKIRTRKESLEKERIILQEKRSAIQEKLREEYGIERVEDEPVTAVKDEDERERLLGEISAIGEVNFRAEKERTELKERLEFLQNQKADLVQAIDSLKKTIAKIDSVSRELFLETFERVNEAFKRFTHTLFKGGHGTLMLNQETNGIDLYVQPPGKKVIRMELLSGGEKALISLAFLLSLMDTKASPFTLMDEIDAPLDDANLLSLLDIVKMISRKTQTILITHNRITMESSNTVYGITMEEDGVSKTISIRL